MNTQRLNDILDLMPGRRVLVVGDVMMDEYVWGKVRRISPEAPVMVVEVQRETFTPGGAANVVNNIQALGGNTSIVGVVGEDTAGRALSSRLQENGVDTSGVIVDPSRPTTRKTRIIAHSQQVVRVDRESGKRLSRDAVKRVVAQVTERIDSVDMVVFSDYNKGMAVEPVTQALFELAGNAGKRVIVNPKPGNVKQFRPSYLVSLNQSEAEIASGITITDEKSIKRAAKRLANTRYGGPEVLLITRGPDGMSLCTMDGEITTVPAHPVEVYDVAGAGDTVVSVLAMSLAAGANVHEAATLANCAGGAAVRKVGVATVSRDEIRAMLKES